MWRTCFSFVLGIAALLPLVARAADKPLSPTAQTPAEELRKALDQVRDVEIADLPLDQAVNQLREQTGLNLIIDRAGVLPSSGLEKVAAGLLVNMPSFSQIRVSGRFHGLPLRRALTKLLRDHKLTHVLVGDTVLITTIEKAAERQLSQSVSVNIQDVPLRQELKRLARETGANIVLDPRMVQEGQTALTIRLDEVPLETVVELLADEAGLRAVRLHNVLYVTSEARAEKLRKPRSVATPSFPGWLIWPDGKGGFRMISPKAGGLSGNGGGIGGLGGIGGFQGGGLGISGVTPPVPLTPPVPKAKPTKSDKEASPAKPAVKPDRKDKPAPKDKPQAKGLRPDSRLPHSRRGERFASAD